MTAKIEDTVAALADKLLQLADAAQGKGVELALTAVRVSAVQSLTAGVVWVIVAYAGVKAARIFGRKVLARLDDPDDIDPPFIGNSLVVAAACCAVFLGVTNVATSLLDVWTYVALTHPELYLAKKMLGG